MRTNIVLDESLVGEAMRVSGARTKREVVDIALRELVAQRRQRDLHMLPGANLPAPADDVRAERRNMARGAG